MQDANATAEVPEAYVKLALARLTELNPTEPSEHVAAYEQLHGVLVDALSEIDQAGAPTPGRPAAAR